MIHLNLHEPIELLWFGEFISPDRGWKHLTRRLFEYELMAVTEGVLFIADEDREYEIGEGEYLIMSPTVFQHGTQECRCRFYWMHFRCPALPASLSLPAHAGFSDAGAVRTIADRLFRAEAAQPRSIHSRYLATELILELAAQADICVTRTPSPASLSERVKDFVFFHRFSDVKVHEIARELGYHEKYLSAVFHAQTGMTLKHYLTEQRLAEAKRLLLETEYTVAEVAYCLNFQTPHNFARFFKEGTGMTAGQFRTCSAPPHGMPET